jgi:hypothetical protein
MKAAYNAVMDGQKLPTVKELGVDFDAALQEDLNAEERAKAESSAMEIDEKAAVADAASAGPDVSARVSLRILPQLMIYSILINVMA